MERKAEPSKAVNVPYLHIFISYAREDALLAQAINAELKTVFTQVMVKTTLDTELKLGEDWRSGLESALREADILLVLATGRQKLSHSYTGFEVGFFSASKIDRLKMKFFDLERFIIPIGILEKTPETVSEIQSLNLTGPLAPFLLDQDMLKNSERFLDKIGKDPSANPLLKLFTRLKGVVQSLYSFDDDVLEDFKKRSKESANRLYKIFFEEFQRRIFTEKYPERKLIVCLPTTARIDSVGDLPPDMTIEFVGPSFEVFQISPLPNRTTTWANFIEQMPHDDTTTAWTDIIRSLIVTAKRDDFAENRRLLASADRKRFFRLFVAKSIVYYSGILELHIYVVEVKPRDYGDLKTTMLLKAISVGLMYRSLFLEDNSSEYSPSTIRATLPRDLPKLVSNLLQELEYVVWMSEDAGLSVAKNLIYIYGGFQRGELERRYGEWEKRKSDLTSSALQVLRAAGDTELELSKSHFEDCLLAFCSATLPMNKEFLGNVLRLLEGIVVNGDKAANKI